MITRFDLLQTGRQAVDECNGDVTPTDSLVVPSGFFAILAHHDVTFRTDGTPVIRVKLTHLSEERLPHAKRLKKYGIRLMSEVRIDVSPAR